GPGQSLPRRDPPRLPGAGCVGATGRARTNVGSRMNAVTRVVIAGIVLGLGLAMGAPSSAQPHRRRPPPAAPQPPPPAQSPMPPPPVDAATQRAHEAYDR